VLDHEGHGLLDVHLNLAGHDRARGVRAGHVAGVDPVGHDRQREVAVGDHADRAAVVADHHGPDVAVAHQLPYAAQAVAALGGHDALCHHL
jgi:hypothetical protein